MKIKLGFRLKYFLFFYQHLRHRILVAVLLSILVGTLDGFGLSMFLPLLQMVDGASSANAEGLGNLQFIAHGIENLGLELNLHVVLLFLIVFFTFKGGVRYLSDMHLVTVQQRFIRRVRLRMVDGINRMLYLAFIKHDIGRIQNTMNNEVNRLSLAYKSYFLALEAFIFVMVYVGFAFFIDTRFALLVTAGGLVSNILYNFIYKRTKGTSRSITADSHFYQGLIVQYTTNFTYLKATGGVFSFSRKLKQTIEDLENNVRKIGLLRAILNAVREPMLIIIVATIIFVQTAVLGGSLGTVLVSLLFFYRALTYMLNMQNSWNQFLSTYGSLESITRFQEELERDEEHYGQRELTVPIQSIALERVNFGYGDKLAVKDIDLSIRRLETIALVGESGSGKTSLAKLIMGLMPPDKGAVKYNGVNASELDIRTVQSKMGFITQDPVIFNDTIFNNVSLWDAKTPENMQRCERALKLSSMWTWVSQLDEREDYQLENSGVNLSGGQKQRISIARELYKQVDVLVMDEATSALDSQTEKEIQQNIEALRGSYTMVIIAHRLSTIRHADRIVILQDGEVRNSGDFHSLLKKDKQFARMVGIQEA